MYKLIGPYTTAPGQRRKYQKWEMWAEDGMVFMENQSDGDFLALTCKEAREKLENFQGVAEVFDKKRQNADPQERAYAISYYQVMRGLVENLRDTIDDAVRQGDPGDAKVREQKMRVFLRSKQTVLGENNTTQAINSLFNVTPEPIIFQPGAKWFAGNRKPKGK